MPNPVKIIDIINQRRACETLDCELCSGQGEVEIFHPETGKDFMDCEACMGSGYNLLGLILQEALKPEDLTAIEDREGLETNAFRLEKNKDWQMAHSSKRHTS